DEQPTEFLPGGGVFRVYFDGTELSWTVSSRDEERKVSSAANASSSSTKCTSSPKKSASVMEPESILVYPNPVSEKVSVVMKAIEKFRMVIVYDLAGRIHPVKSIEKGPDRLELDLSGLPSGPYFIKIVMEDTLQIVQVIRK
ncbi:MAG TPA: T9SS type A sorting domain-containing protein, partial [Bacteroides sp.]|nr:T9SS type A sorting domain-containing protein [Bacteroides sp.]